MKFQVISDIHLEFYTSNLWKLVKQIKITGDNLILAGDIGYPEKTIFTDFLHYVHQKYKKVFLVSGNHEYYQHWKREGYKTVEEIDNIVEQQVSKYNNIFYLNNSFHDFEDNGKKYRILGSTLWFYPENNDKIISDYHNVYINRDNHLSNIDNNYIEEKWKKSQLFIKENIHPEFNNIVITHHLPSYKLISYKYLDDKYKKYNFYFASNCEDLIKHPIKFWISGHSHSFVEKNINGVKCIINAFGYPMESITLETKLDYSFIL